MRLGLPQCRLAVLGLDRVEPGLAEREDEQLTDVRIVVDDQDRARHGARDHRFGLSRQSS